MSTGKRAYDILRGYVGREWERLQGLEDKWARVELDEAVEQPVPSPQAARSGGYDPLARIDPDNGPTDEQKQLARRLLGVEATEAFPAIRAKFEELNKRAQPENFPEGTPEARQAADIQKRIHWAYAVLTWGQDSTRMRFGSLEI